jgi:hypothetical protein
MTCFSFLILRVLPLQKEKKDRSDKNNLYLLFSISLAAPCC